MAATKPADVTRPAAKRSREGLVGLRSFTRILPASEPSRATEHKFAGYLLNLGGMILA